MSNQVFFIEHKHNSLRFQGMSHEILKADGIHAYRWDGNSLEERRDAASPWLSIKELDASLPLLLRLRHGGDNYPSQEAVLSICYGGNTAPDSRRESFEFCLNRSIVDSNFLTADEASQILSYARNLAAGSSPSPKCPAFLIPPVPNPTLEDEITRLENEWLNS